jgi:surfeit locus 1 family protein
MIHRPPPLATLLMLAALAVLCSLGVWQLHRLEWKTALIEKLDAEYAKHASNIILDQKALAKIEDARPFVVRGTVRGRYDYSGEILVGPRVFGNLPGYHVLTPFIVEGPAPATLIVNRGWVPQHWDVASDQKTQPGSVSGLLRRPDENPFAPENIPEKNQWYRTDPGQIAGVKNLPETYGYVLYREGAEGESEYPVTGAARPELPNNHLQYAIFWFTMAGTLLVVYALRFLRKSASHG